MHFDFEPYKTLRNKRRAGEDVTAGDIGGVIGNLKHQIAKQTAEIAALVMEDAEAGAMRRLALMTNGDHGDAEATAAMTDLRALSEASRRLQKLLYWQKKATIGLGSDKTLPGYQSPYTYGSYGDPFAEGDDEDEDVDLDQLEQEAMAEQAATSNALTNKLAEEQAASTEAVCGNCGFRSKTNPCNICGNQLS